MAGRNSLSLEMNPWRARKIAVKWRAGSRYSINLPKLLRGWRRRNKKLTLDQCAARDTGKGDGGGLVTMGLRRFASDCRPPYPTSQRQGPFDFAQGRLWGTCI